MRSACCFWSDESPYSGGRDCSEIPNSGCQAKKGCSGTSHMTAHVVADGSTACPCLSLCEMNLCGHFVSFLESRLRMPPNSIHWKKAICHCVSNLSITVMFHTLPPSTKIYRHQFFVQLLQSSAFQTKHRGQDFQTLSSPRLKRKNPCWDHSSCLKLPKWLLAWIYSFRKNNKKVQNLYIVVFLKVEKVLDTNFF